MNINIGFPAYDRLVYFSIPSGVQVHILYKNVIRVYLCVLNKKNQPRLKSDITTSQVLCSGER
jgi:hypothetical protein